MRWNRPAPRRAAAGQRGSAALILILVLALALAVLPGSSPGAQQGGALPGLTGGQLSAADLAQGTHIVVVWASWSPRCRDIASRVNQLTQKLSGQGRVITVNFQEEADKVADFVRQHPLDAPVYLDRDGEFSKGHAVTALPGLIVVRKGEVLFQGRLAEEAETQIRDLLR